jgi:hypothetical protein
MRSFGYHRSVPKLLPTVPNWLMQSPTCKVILTGKADRYLVSRIRDLMEVIAIQPVDNRVPLLLMILCSHLPGTW